MQNKNWIIPAAVIVAVVVIVAVLMTAQSPRTSTTAPPQTATQITTVTQTATTTQPAASSITAGGATFPMPQWQYWARLFYEKTGITVNYQGTGSGAGQANFIQKTFAFAGTDVPLAPQNYKSLVEQYGRGALMQCPEVIGSVVIAYNVPEIAYSKTRTPLRLSSDVLAMIFSGEIKYWDDPRIKGMNPQLAGLLPHQQIVRVVRADPSGTNAVFTLYLNKSSPFWQSRVGKWGLSIDWPNASSGLLKGQGNPGVASTVESTPYSIGYIEYNYWAVKVDKYNSFGGVALLEGGDGRYYYPNETSITVGVSAALDAVAKKLGAYPSPYDDWNPVTLAFVYPPSGYPIVSFSFFAAWTNYAKAGLSPSVGAAVKQFLTYVLTEGQKNMLPGYLPLPQQLADICLKAVEQIS